MARSAIANDTRPIKAIWFSDGVEVAVGKKGVEKIEAYDDFGPGDFVPWLAIYRNGAIELRVPAHWTTIGYYEAPAAEQPSPQPQPEPEAQTADDAGEVELVEDEVRT